MSIFNLIVMVATVSLTGACSHQHKHHDANNSAGHSCTNSLTSTQKDEMSCSGKMMGQGEHHKNMHSEEMHSAQVTKGEFADVPYYFRSNTFFSGAMNEKSLNAARDAKVAAVINLQQPEELNWDEKAYTEKLGMKYYNYPVSGSSDTIDLATLKNIEDTYMKHHKAGEKVIVHCKSGMRSAAWFTYHLNKTHGDTLEKSIEGAKAVGLNKTYEEKMVKTLKK